MSDPSRGICALLCALLIVPFLGASGATAQSQGKIGYAAANASGDALALFNQGASLLRSNRNQEAAAKLERACLLSPNFAEAHQEWALALLKLDRVSEAIDQFNQALKLDPSLATSWLSLGAAYQASGRVGEAVAAYKTFLSRFPSDDDGSRVRNLIANLERENNDPKLTTYMKANAPPASPVASEPLGGGRPSGLVSQEQDSPKIRWPAKRMPLRVYIGKGELIPGFRLPFVDVVKEAFLRWAEESEGLVSFVFVEEAADADIVCRWSANALKYKKSAEPAQTNLFSDGHGLAKGEIEILTTPRPADPDLTVTRLRTTALHEVGHALGMTGHSGNANDIMFNSFASTDTARDLSEADKNALIRLYKSK